MVLLRALNLVRRSAHIGRLPAIPSVREIIKLYGLSARAELSQNFLLDHNLTERIARAAKCEGSTVLEVGAGPGPLTRSLLEMGAAKVIAVDKDRRFKDALDTIALSPGAGGKLRVIIGDMLEQHEADLLRAENVAPVAWDQPTPVRLVGNLPFNVGTQLLLKWLRQCHARTGLYSEFGRVPLTLLLQKEVAQVRLGPLTRAVLKSCLVADCGIAALERVLAALYCSASGVFGKMLV